MFDSVCELVGETIRNMLGVVVILLWNVLKVFSVDEDALLDKKKRYSSGCACCVCDLSVNSIGYVYVLYVGCYLLI